MNEDRIAKQNLNVILVVDSSRSMEGTRISQVNSAIKDIQNYLKILQIENINVDFYLTVIKFSNDGVFVNPNRSDFIDDFKIDDIKCGGYSNLHCGYQRLEEILKKNKDGGIMPDFGGVAPIILLLTDGHPTGNMYMEELYELKKLPWFNCALKYGIAIELNDARTKKVLSDFTGDVNSVVTCYDANILKQIIKVIVITASKVKSSSTKAGSNQSPNTQYKGNTSSNNQNIQLVQEINDNLSDIEGFSW